MDQSIFSMAERDRGDSPVLSEVMILGLVLILGLIILAYLLGLISGLFPDGMLAPPIIKITAVLHTSASGTMNLAIRVFIENTGAVEYKNRDLIAVFLRNGEEIYAEISTLHGEGFIPTQHFGVATMGGAGCRGEFFSPGEKIEINLNNGRYRPGDRVEVRIYQKSSDQSLIPLTVSIGNPRDFQEWVEEVFYSRHPGYRLISQHSICA